MNKTFLTIFCWITIIILKISALELATSDIFVFRVGVVDMDKVLQNYPKAQQYEYNYIQMKNIKQQEISLIEQEIENLMKKKIEYTTELEQLNIQLKQLQQKQEVFVSTQNVEISSVEQKEYSQQIQQINSNIESRQKDISEIEKTISEKRNLLKEKQKEMESELDKYKEKSEAEIFASLYEIISEVAVEEKLNIVIEKSGILYGIPEIDITDKIIKHIQK